MTPKLSIMTIATVFLVGIIAPALIDDAHATISGGIVDKTTFLSSTGAVSATGPIPNVGAVGTGTQNLGTVDLTPAVTPRTMWFGGQPIAGFNADWTSLITPYSIAINGPEHLKAEFSVPVFSAGFEFVEPTCGRSATPCTGAQTGDIGVNWSNPIDSSFRVDLSLAGSPVYSFVFNAPNDVASFVGISGDVPFDTMIITEIIGNADNEFYGQFYTSTVIPVEIDIKPGSDPSSWNCKKAKGGIPVAVFSTANFDATTIDHTSLTVEGIPATEVHGTLHLEDKNNDGLDDAVLHLDSEAVCDAASHIPLKETGFVTLAGFTTDGDSFKGTGDIRIVKR